MTVPQAPAARVPSAATTGARKLKPSCARCYFGLRMLCALERDEPCATFRPDSAEGLMPPAQPTLLVRSEPTAVPGVAPPLAAAA